MADSNEKEKSDLNSLIKSIDTEEPKEMRPIWEGFSLDIKSSEKDEK